jgi:ribosome modulation factor
MKPEKPWLKIGLTKSQYAKTHKQGYYSGKLGASIETNPCRTPETRITWEDGYRVGLQERHEARDKTRGL